jgi:hypothetical protein
MFVYDVLVEVIEQDVCIRIVWTYKGKELVIICIRYAIFVLICIHNE